MHVRRHTYVARPGQRERVTAASMRFVEMLRRHGVRAYVVVDGFSTHEVSIVEEYASPESMRSSHVRLACDGAFKTLALSWATDVYPLLMQRGEHRPRVVSKAA